MIDIHSHILYGIDDGARDLEESLAMAEMAAGDGIQQMICTPHMFNGLSNDPQPAEVIDRVAALQKRIGDRLTVLPGNEVHISHELADQAEKNRFTRLNLGNYVLVEFPSISIPFGAVELMYRLQLQRLHPILVHPERNREIQMRPSIIGEYVERGIFIQVTAMSITGEFGSAAKICVEQLLKHKCVHFIATDAHRAAKRPPILSRGRDAAAAIVGKKQARRLVFDNPSAVIGGKLLSVEAPLPF